MKLGIISLYNRPEFDKAKELGLDCLEFDINVDVDVDAFEACLPRLQNDVARTGVTVGAIGRWGADRLLEDGSINEIELALETRLIKAAAALKCPVYITGCNYRPALSYEENCQCAVVYFRRLLEVGAAHGVKICTYNCDWNNFVYEPKAWSQIHSQLPELGIKYDSSHCLARGNNCLQELFDWGRRVYHVHLKGSLVVDGQYLNDMPVGMDTTNWAAFLGILYMYGYQGSLSLEPHGRYWGGEKRDLCVALGVRNMRRLLLEETGGTK